MTTKNIVNIQNNKLDFYVNGTNKFNVTLRGKNILEVNELGYIKAGQTTAVTDETNPKAVVTHDFSGYISNIDNHSIGNLDDVSISTASDNQLLQYNSATSKWENKDLADVVPSGVLTINDGAFPQDITIGTDTFNINGNVSSINVSLLEGTNKGIGLSLVENVQIATSLRVGSTNPGAFTVQNGTDGFEITNSSSPSFALNQTAAGKTTLNSHLGQNVIISNGDIAALTVSTNAVTVSNDLVVTGNLTVSGTNVILNTEVKLIEDSIIELNYISGTLVDETRDIGFAGRYTNEQYCGFVYDTSANHFKVFDSMQNFDNQTKNIQDANASFANIVGKGFDARKGQIGSDVIVISNATNPIASWSASSALALYYAPELNTNYGIFCGRLIACSYSSDYTSFAITTLNYTLSYSIEGTVFTATVDLETKETNHNYLSYDNSDESFNYTPPDDAQANPPTLVMRILPITAINF